MYMLVETVTFETIICKDFDRLLKTYNLHLLELRITLPVKCRGIDIHVQCAQTKIVFALTIRNVGLTILCNQGRVRTWTGILVEPD